MNTVKVQLGPYSYPIFIDSDILPKLAEMLTLYRSERKFVLVTDETVNGLHADKLVDGFQRANLRLERIVIAAGETTKSLASFEQIITQMLQFGASRDWGVIAFGGGVIGDLAGYVAASYMRGVTFVQVPTTLLAQVDASVGGKVGVNHPLAKNLIGAFYQPKLVWIDTGVLRTLSERDLVCGLAEILKYGAIYDRDFFYFIEKEYQGILASIPDRLNEAVCRSCEIKAEIVAQDEKEHGIREILNFGHTIGHAIEALTNFSTIRHGEAVLIGMLAEAYIAMATGLLAEAEFIRFERLISRIPLKATIDGIDHNEIVLALRRDKKVRNDRVRFVLPATLGATKIIDDVSVEAIHNALSYVVTHGW